MERDYNLEKRKYVIGASVIVIAVSYTHLLESQLVFYRASRLDNSFHTLLIRYLYTIGEREESITGHHCACLLYTSIRTEGSARTFRIVHIMTDNPLTGISDIGIRLREPENQ